MIKHLILGLGLIMTSSVFAYQENIVARHNSFGGKTTLSKFPQKQDNPLNRIYAEIENFDQLGIKKILEYYDAIDRLRKAEVYFKLDKSNQTDYIKTIDLFDSSQRRTRSIYYYKPKAYRHKGYYKRVVVYNHHGGFTRETVYYIKRLAAAQGFYKAKLYRDENGDVVRIDRFDHRNRLLDFMPKN